MYQRQVIPFEKGKKPVLVIGDGFGIINWRVLGIGENWIEIGYAYTVVNTEKYVAYDENGHASSTYSQTFYFLNPETERRNRLKRAVKRDDFFVSEGVFHKKHRPILFRDCRYKVQVAEDDKFSDTITIKLCDSEKANEQKSYIVDGDKVHEVQLVFLD